MDVYSLILLKTLYQKNRKCQDISLALGQIILILIDSGKVNIESAIILDHFLNWIDYVEREVDDEWIWPRIRNMLRKCQPFIKFNETKCKEILRSRVESVIQKT